MLVVIRMCEHRDPTLSYDVVNPFLTGSAADWTTGRIRARQANSEQVTPVLPIAVLFAGEVEDTQDIRVIENRLAGLVVIRQCDKVMPVVAIRAKDNWCGVLAVAAKAVRMHLSFVPVRMVLIRVVQCRLDRWTAFHA